MERSLLLFKESVKSKETFDTYLVRVKLFMKYHGIESYDEMLRRPNLQEMFEDWIISTKQHVNPNGLATYFYGVKNFFDANEVEKELPHQQEKMQQWIDAGNHYGTYPDNDILSELVRFSQFCLYRNEIP